MKIHNLKRLHKALDLSKYDWPRGTYRVYYYLSHRYYRRIRTIAEMKAGQIAEDLDVREEVRSCDQLVRSGRRSLPNSWDDPRISINYGKSWKDHTKCRKQWGVNL